MELLNRAVITEGEETSMRTYVDCDKYEKAKDFVLFAENKNFFLLNYYYSKRFCLDCLFTFFFCS